MDRTHKSLYQVATDGSPVDALDRAGAPALALATCVAADPRVDEVSIRVDSKGRKVYKVEDPSHHEECRRVGVHIVGLVVVIEKFVRAAHAILNGG